MDIPLFNMVLLIKNFDESKLNNILDKFISKIGASDFRYRILSTEKYYKLPELQECVVCIYSNKYVSLKKILLHFIQVYWKYQSPRNSIVTKDEISCIFQYEDAYWDSDFQREYFLDPDLKWVNIKALPIDPDISGDE